MKPRSQLTRCHGTEMPSGKWACTLQPRGVWVQGSGDRLRKLRRQVTAGQACCQSPRRVCTPLGRPRPASTITQPRRDAPAQDPPHLPSTVQGPRRRTSGGGAGARRASTCPRLAPGVAGVLHAPQPAVAHQLPPGWAPPGTGRWENVFRAGRHVGVCNQTRLLGGGEQGESPPLWPTAHWGFQGHETKALVLS